VSLSLLLFSTDPCLVGSALGAGAAGVVVDWERNGKVDRQRGADTQIGTDTLEDLRRVRAATRANLLCRVNPWDLGGAEELERAAEAGADEVLLPMVRHPREVERALDLAAGRCRVGILVETLDAVARAPELGRLPLSRVYVGLNDLAIERGTRSIFTPLLDGTLERIRPAFQAPFGFGGLTLPELGAPVPCRLLLGEMLRLRCDFTFLRRSFLRDVRGRDVSRELPRIRAAVEAAEARNPAAVAADRRLLVSTVEQAEAARAS
jgi:hypothetical protein